MNEEQRNRLLEAKRKLHASAAAPFDHTGEGEPMPATDWAHAAARGIMHDLTDRQGVGDELECLDDELRKEIVETAADIIRAAAPSTEVPGVENADANG